ncbi:MAG: Shikimate kinase [uncultured bacterium]|nr:MAG: Shikimate kinase [uncultured bacterium]HBH19291.1 shikimate kinase [Cyanobacteria bacterium UBA9579]
MAKNIVLTGLMGSGKSTVGSLIAQKLGKIFVDTDKLIEEDAQININEIFAQYGEAYFRELEAKIIKRVSPNSDQVISTGGGTLINPDNLKNLKDNGALFYLKASAKTLFERIKNENNRPLLKNNDPLSTLEKLLEKREEFYNQADFIINTENKQIDRIVSEIIEKYRDNNE